MKIQINDTRYLDSATDIKHKDVVVIASEGKWEESQRFKKEDGTPQNEFRINLKLSNGEVRNTTLNWTNVKLLVSAFGDETVSWVGKEVRAWKTKSEKAKSGFVYLYVPTNWERDDTGEWIKPESVDERISPEDQHINIDDIPF